MTLTSQIGDVLASAVATRGLTLDSYRVAAVHDRPGAECSIIADIEASGTVMTLVASTVELSDADRDSLGAVRLVKGTDTVHVWPYPMDPHLPGLAVVATAPSVQKAMALIDPGVSVESSTVTVYRPLRRAVAHVTGTRDGRPTEWFIKVTRPDRAAALLHRMDLLQRITPPSYGLGSGLVVSSPAPGRSLHHVLGDQCRLGQPLLATPEWIMGVLTRLPREATGLPERASWTDRREQYREAAERRGLDGKAVHAVLDAIDASVRAHDAGPVVATHGDLHAANIFVPEDTSPSEDAVLIDVDSVGPGRRVDDVACVMGHLAVSASLAPAHFAGIGPTLDGWLAEWETMTGMGSIRARAAAVVLSLAATTAPENLAREWLRVARALSEGDRLMRTLSSSSP